MIHVESLTLAWIEKTAKTNRNADKILVEKVIRALYLLELLQLSGLRFLFKGGTSLMLLTQQTKRLSIDVDIIVPEKPDDLSSHLTYVIEQSDFIRLEKNVRGDKNDIQKAHYKFYYQPVTSSRASEEYILLDILFEASPYATFTALYPIRSDFIQTDAEGIFTEVTIPTPEAILGDKLTAYAPNTTSVPYGKNKEIEIIKQLYDIGNLFDQIKDLKPVADVFQTIAGLELKYRKLAANPQIVLEDIWETSLHIATRGKEGNGNLAELQRGIKNIRTFIFSEPFHIEAVMLPAAKAAYLSALLQKSITAFKRFTNPKEIATWQVEQPFSTRLNKLKKSNPEAFFYWYHATKLLKDNE
uniref:Nucleotidyl transferase AbiEii/AbiGii toxin family protein n=1 Tax=Roseihalotalea indica TaxID=2867963 RepID=A0AA49GMA6_9BACT|nr:nucleotidyl transferase AbiEii/AbiGii toxin family protein [Tunicatimonas sp. TK19036]